MRYINVILTNSIRNRIRVNRPLVTRVKISPAQPDCMPIVSQPSLSLIALSQGDNPASSDSARQARSHGVEGVIDPDTIPDAVG